MTLPEPPLCEARALKINISQACESDLVREVNAASARQWQAENQAATDAWNEYVEQNGLPLAEFRQF